MAVVDAEQGIVAFSDTTGRVAGRALEGLEHGTRWLELGGRRLFVRSTDRSSVELWAAGRRLIGRVVDASGRGLSGVTVCAGPSWEHPPEVTTDAEGAFVFPDITPSALELRVVGPGVVEFARGRRVPESQEETHVQLELPPGHTVRLCVRTPTGELPEDRLVHWEHPDPENPDGCCYCYARVDAAGQAVLAVPAGVDFFLQAPGFRGWVDGQAVPDQIFLSAPEPRAPERKVDGDEDSLHREEPDPDTPAWIPIDDPRVSDGHLPDDLQVLVWDPALPWQLAYQVDCRVAEALIGRHCWDTRDGVHHTEWLYDHFLEVQPLAPGPYRVWLWSAGHDPVVLDAEATVDGVRPAPTSRPRVHPTARLEVEVVDAAGKPCAHGGVRAVPEPGQGPFLHGGGFTAETPTQVGGTTQVDLPPGRYRVSPVVGWERAGPTVVATVPGPPVRLVVDAPRQRTE